MNHMMFGINMNSLVNFKRHVVYRECVHNHAASLGGVARDGCYEFLQPRLVDGCSPEEAMRCAVCGCHRNYHRRQIVLTPPMPPQRPPTIMAANEGNVVEGPAVAVAAPPLRRRKWKRTNFTEEQKSRMASFAEMLGWRVKRADKEETLRFCMEIGITRKMFVVWLNNNRRENSNQTNEG